MTNVVRVILAWLQAFRLVLQAYLGNVRAMGILQWLVRSR